MPRQWSAPAARTHAWSSLRTSVGERFARGRAGPRRASPAVSLPVNVFCWLGWKQPSSVPGAGVASAPWPKRGRGRGAACRARRAGAARRPRRTRRGRRRPATSGSCASSATDHGRQASRSSGVGLLAGGAQRTAAVIQASRELQPVAARGRRSAGWRSRSRCSAANRKSPERSPVNTRPVRLAPWAAGARPRTSTRAAGSPKPGTGGPSTPRRRTRRA